MDHALTFPVFSRAEQLADRTIHLVGVAAAALAMPLLVVIGAAQSALVLWGVLVYGVAALVMLVASALYNLAPPSGRKEILRRVDHAAIFVMIAGTYTPLALCRIGGAWGLGLLAYVWLVAIAGVTIKLRYPRRFERVSIGIYLALGWSVLPMLAPMLAALSGTAAILIVAGGFLYSIGVAFHLWRRLPYHNAIWHGLVLAGVSCHYAAVLIDVALGPA